MILVLGRFQTLWHKGNQSSGRQRQQQQEEEEEEEYGRLINWRRKDEEDKKKSVAAGGRVNCYNSSSRNGMNQCSARRAMARASFLPLREI